MPTPPAAPQSLLASLTGAGQVDLSWQDLSDNESGFEVWRAEGSPGAWAILAQTGANATGHLDDSVSPATLYAYKVRAFNRWGHSGFSGEAGVATPTNSGGGCGYELIVESAVLRLDGIPADLGGLNRADARALLEGNLAAWIRSPPGNAHPVRVVLGFRDASGRAAGTPVELVNFYRVPGCPGLSVGSAVPEAFRAPESGTNTLWLEMIMAQRDPVVAFMTERHTQESPMRKRVFDVALRGGASRGDAGAHVGGIRHRGEPRGSAGPMDFERRRNRRGAFRFVWRGTPVDGRRGGRRRAAGLDAGA
jgi:hypothetical protein